MENENEKFEREKEERRKKDDAKTKKNKARREKIKAKKDGKVKDKSEAKNGMHPGKRAAKILKPIERSSNDVEIPDNDAATTANEIVAEVGVFIHDDD